MKKLIFGLIATVFFSMSFYAQEGRVITSSFSQSRSDVEIPSELKSFREWSEDNSNQFITISVYKKEYQAFISVTLDIKDSEDVKIVTVNAPKEVTELNGFNAAETLRKIPCWTIRCVIIDIINWIHSL